MSQTISVGQESRSGVAGWLWPECFVRSKLGGAGGLTSGAAPSGPVIIKEPQFLSVGYWSAHRTRWLPDP